MKDWWTWVEPAWERVSIYDGPEAFDLALAAEHPIVRVLLPIVWLNSEVCNGGFDQCFWNDTGVVAPVAHECLIKVGRPDVAEVVASAMRLVGDPFPRDRETRQKILDAPSWDFEASGRLDKFYYERKAVDERGRDLLSHLTEYANRISPPE